MNPSAADRARKIRVILFDVDGVLTDGSIWLFPAAGPSQQAAELTYLRAHGYALVFADDGYVVLHRPADRDGLRSGRPTTRQRTPGPGAVW